MTAVSQNGDALKYAWEAPRHDREIATSLDGQDRPHLKGGNGKGGIRICLPVHCLSARSDRQPYCHTNATSSPY